MIDLDELEMRMATAKGEVYEVPIAALIHELRAAREVVRLAWVWQLAKTVQRDVPGWTTEMSRALVAYDEAVKP